jgi:uncharacterized membrane protein
MNAFLSLGRWIFPVPFIVFGLFHYIGATQYADMLPSYMPGGIWLIYFVGTCMIAAGISLLLGIRDKLAATLLAVLLLLIIIFIHAPGAIGGGERSQLSTTMLFKDLGLMAAAMMYAQSRQK